MSDRDGSDRTIADFHATRESGTGCPADDSGKHYFIFLDPQIDGRSCMDCGEPENYVSTSKEQGDADKK